MTVNQNCLKQLLKTSPATQTTHCSCSLPQSQDGTYQRKLVPALLRKTSFDLDTVLEFCDAYLVRPEGRWVGGVSTDY